MLTLDPVVRESRVHAVAESSAPRTPRELLPAHRGVDVKLQEIADRLGCRLEGDGAIEITGVATLEDAQPGQLTFFANPKYISAAQTDARVRGHRGRDG